MKLYPDKQYLIDLANYKMHFGKYKGRYLVDLPESYLLWFQQKGFPAGKSGIHLQQMLEIKMNGLEPLIRKIRKDFPGDTR